MKNAMLPVLVLGAALLPACGRAQRVAHPSESQCYADGRASSLGAVVDGRRCDPVPGASARWVDAGTAPPPAPRTAVASQDHATTEPPCRQLNIGDSVNRMGSVFVPGARPGDVPVCPETPHPVANAAVGALRLAVFALGEIL